jgi:hypothetical protein
MATKEEGATSEEYHLKQDGKIGENYGHFNSSNVGKVFNFQTGQQCQLMRINYFNK